MAGLGASIRTLFSLSLAILWTVSDVATYLAMMLTSLSSVTLFSNLNLTAQPTQSCTADPPVMHGWQNLFRAMHITSIRRCYLSTNEVWKDVCDYLPLQTGRSFL